MTNTPSGSSLFKVQGLEFYNFLLCYFLLLTSTVACPKQKTTTCLVRQPYAQLPVLEQCLVGSLTGAVAS